MFFLQLNMMLKAILTDSLVIEVINSGKQRTMLLASLLKRIISNSLTVTTILQMTSLYGSTSKSIVKQK
jgi:hypothetical protein